jgi:copper chaperone CopZ
MTKVQLHYELERPLQDADAEAVANVHGYYGIMRVSIAPALDRITVDFDASRLSEKDVEAALIRYGVPIKRQPVSA